MRNRDVVGRLSKVGALPHARDGGALLRGALLGEQVPAVLDSSGLTEMRDEVRIGNVLDEFGALGGNANRARLAPRIAALLADVRRETIEAAVIAYVDAGTDDPEEIEAAIRAVAGPCARADSDSPSEGAATPSSDGPTGSDAVKP